MTIPNIKLGTAASSHKFFALISQEKHLPVFEPNDIFLYERKISQNGVTRTFLEVIQFARDGTTGGLIRGQKPEHFVFEWWGRRPSVNFVQLGEASGPVGMEKLILTDVYGIKDYNKGGSWDRFTLIHREERYPAFCGTLTKVRQDWFNRISEMQQAAGDGQEGEGAKPAPESIKN